MKIKITTFDETEAKIIFDKAKELNIDPDGLVELYEAVINSNFEQDIHDIALENGDFLVREYGLDNQNK